MGVPVCVDTTGLKLAGRGTGRGLRSRLAQPRPGCARSAQLSRRRLGAWKSELHPFNGGEDLRHGRIYGSDGPVRKLRPATVVLEDRANGTFAKALLVSEIFLSLPPE